MLSVISLLIFTISYAEKDQKQSQVTIDYQYDKELNQVIAVVNSEVGFKNTKASTWELSEDGKSYSKKYTENTDYNTIFQDIYGNEIIVNIVVTQIQIKKAQLSLNYIYNENTNQVVVEVNSDVEFQPTKASTWKLSEDKKIYSKVYDENTNYNTVFKDIYGNDIVTNIIVTDIKTSKIELNYVYDSEKNQVTVEVISDVEFKNTKASTWKLSENKKIYRKVYTDNTNYNTIFQDKWGNNICTNIVISQIDKEGPNVKLDYFYNDDDTVTISINSNEIMKNNKNQSWVLSNDGLRYEKKYSHDEDYFTTVEDLYGNITPVEIKLKKKKHEYKQADGSTITVKYMYTIYENVIVQIHSTIRMENTKAAEWKLSEDGYDYTKVFYEDTKYTTQIQDINGLTKNVLIDIDFYYNIKTEKGGYGISGAWVQGVPGGSELEYLRWGNGNNVFFATFCVHGYEDSWDKDGKYLVDIANQFYNTLVESKDKELAKKWTIYILKEVNPDGINLGNTCNGPGRTTVYSKTGKGIDINRSWPTESTYKTYNTSRNYNGTAPFQAYEAEYLKNFLLKNKSNNGQNVLVDLHGWEDQLIGNEQICQYYKQNYTSCSTRNYGKYGTQFLIGWARQNLAAKSALIELPLAYSKADAENKGLTKKYIDATLNMLKGI